MTRQTSIEAFHQIKENGLLSGRRFEVYEYIFHRGPCTAKEIDVKLRSTTQSTGVYTTRLSELRDQGVIKEVGETTCQYTGHKVILWDVTADLPRKLNPRLKPTKVELIDQLCTQVEWLAKNLLIKDEKIEKLLILCSKYRRRKKH